MSTRHEELHRQLSLAEMRRSDPQFTFVYDELEKCDRDLSKVYQLGVSLRKGTIPGYISGSRRTLCASLKCFQYALSQRLSTPELYHNLGDVNYRLGNVDLAENAFGLASAMGLEAATRNLIRILESRADYSPLPSDAAKIERGCRFMANSRKTPPEQIAASLFTEVQLSELKRVALLLHDKTTTHDCVLFLGRSPLWIAEMFTALRLPRTTLCIPYSGGKATNFLSVSEDTCATFAAFIEFLGSRGINSTFFEGNEKKKLYIVDRVETGQSVITFTEILHMISPQFDERTHIIGFIDDHIQLTQKGPLAFDLNEMERTTVDEISKKHGPFQQYTPGIDFYMSDWKKWREKDFNPKVSDIVAARRAQIDSWVAALLKPKPPT